MFGLAYFNFTYDIAAHTYFPEYDITPLSPKLKEIFLASLIIWSTEDIFPSSVCGVTSQ